MMECDSDSTQEPDYDDEILLSNQHLLSSSSSQSIDNQETNISVSSSDQDMMYDSRFDPGFGSSVPLKRIYRRMRKEISPYYTPEDIACSQYTATILAMFRHYRYRLLRAQRLTRCCMCWGKPVLPGRHHTKTIDQRKRGAPSINMDSSEEEEIDIPVHSPGDPMPKVKSTLPADIGRKILKDFCSKSERESRKRGGDGNSIQSQQLRERRSGNDKMPSFSENTQIYDLEQIDDKELRDSAELQTNKKRKMDLNRGSRKTFISSPKASPVASPVQDAHLSDTEEILIDSQSNSKDSNSSHLSQFGKHPDNDDEDSRPGSQDCNPTINRDGEFYSTQVSRFSRRQRDSPRNTAIISQNSKLESENCRTKPLATLKDSRETNVQSSQEADEKEESFSQDSLSSQVRKVFEEQDELSRNEALMEMSKRKFLVSSGDDDEMIESFRRKRKKNLPVSIMVDESEQNEVDSNSDADLTSGSDFDSKIDFKAKGSQTYSRSRIIEKTQSSSIDFDKILSHSGLKYKPADIFQDSSVSPRKSSVDPKPGNSLPDCNPQKHERKDISTCPIIQSNVPRKSKKPFSLFYSTEDNLIGTESVKPSLRKTKSIFSSLPRSRKDSPDVVSILKDNDIPSQSKCSMSADSQKKRRRMVITGRVGETKKTQPLWSELPEVSGEEEPDLQDDVVVTRNSSSHSPSGELSLEEVIQVDENKEENVECPLCCEMFSMSEIERHAATCGEDLYQVEPVSNRTPRVDEELVRQTRSRQQR